MSNLSSLMQGGTVQVAESVEYEPMTESQMSQLMKVAIEEVAIESATEDITNNDTLVLEGVLPEDAVVMEKTIVKLDKAAKKQKAYKLAILQCAKDDDNKDYKRLVTIWQMEKYLMRKLEKKYAARARSRMHQTSKKASNTGFGAKVKKHLASGPKMTKSQRETQKALAGNTKPPSQLKSQFNSISNKLSGKIK